MDTFYDISSAAGYSGVESLRRQTGKPAKQVRAYLSKQPTYRKYKFVREGRRARAHVESLGISFQSDLFYVKHLSHANKGYKYIVVLVDSFSRYLSARPLKNKTGPEMAQVLDEMFADLKEQNRLGWHVILSTDRGTEFLGPDCDRVYAQYKIDHIFLSGKNKAFFAEQYGRILLRRLFMHMHANKTKVWYTSLQDAVAGQNARVLKSTGMAAKDVNLSNQRQVYEKLFPRPTDRRERNADIRYEYELGDKVNVRRTDLPFSKERLGRFSEQVYTVTQQHWMDPPMYSIEDGEGYPILQKFYGFELQRV